MSSASIADPSDVGPPEPALPEARAAAAGPSAETAPADQVRPEIDEVRHLYRRLLRSEVVTLVLGLVLILCFAQTASRTLDPVAPRVRYVSDTGRGYPVEPIRGPLHPGPWIRTWAENAILAAYSVDYLNYRAEFTHIRPRFTASGWASFAAAFKGSGDFQRLLKGRLVSNAQAQGPPVLRNETRDRYVIQFPMVDTFANDNETVTRRLMVTVFVRPAAIERHREGFAIYRVMTGARVP